MASFLTEMALLFQVRIQSTHHLYDLYHWNIKMILSVFLIRSVFTASFITISIIPYVCISRRETCKLVHFSLCFLFVDFSSYFSIISSDMTLVIDSTHPSLKLVRAFRSCFASWCYVRLDVVTILTMLSSKSFLFSILLSSPYPFLSVWHPRHPCNIRG